MHFATVDVNGQGLLILLLMLLVAALVVVCLRLAHQLVGRIYYLFSGKDFDKNKWRKKTRVKDQHEDDFFRD